MCLVQSGLLVFGISEGVSCHPSVWKFFQVPFPAVDQLMFLKGVGGGWVCTNTSGCMAGLTAHLLPVSLAGYWQ